jgi:hypothetical protein
MRNAYLRKLLVVGAHAVLVPHAILAKEAFRHHGCIENDATDTDITAKSAVLDAPSSAIR